MMDDDGREVPGTKGYKCDLTINDAQYLLVLTIA